MEPPEPRDPPDPPPEPPDDLNFCLGGFGAGMIGNPLNPPDPVLVTKLASIGIGPGKTPSTEANDTIKTALQNGITEGQKLIDARVGQR